MAIVEMCLRIRFLFAAWNIRFAFGAARLVVSKSKETKWRFEKVEMAACVVGRVRD